MSNDAAKNTTTRDYSKIGYYGRPITELGKKELLAAFIELLDICWEAKRKNDRCKELLGKKFDSL